MPQAKARQWYFTLTGFANISPCTNTPTHQSDTDVLPAANYFPTSDIRVTLREKADKPKPASPKLHNSEHNFPVRNKVGYLQV